MLMSGWSENNPYLKHTIRLCNQTRLKRKTNPKNAKRTTRKLHCNHTDVYIPASFFMSLYKLWHHLGTTKPFIGKFNLSRQVFWHHKRGTIGHHFLKTRKMWHHERKRKSLENLVFSRLWRTGWDSNPRAGITDKLISSYAKQK